MELTGSLPSKADKEPLWNALLNIENWKEALPGITKYETTGPNTYELTVHIEIGPIKGDQTGTLVFTNLQPGHSFDFELQSKLIKTVKGTIELKDPAATVDGTGEAEPAAFPEGTKTVLVYRLEVDAGNPIFNAVIESQKGKAQENFEGLLRTLDNKAQAA